MAKTAILATFAADCVRVFAHHGYKVIILRYFATLAIYAKITALILSVLGRVVMDWVRLVPFFLLATHF